MNLLQQRRIDNEMSQAQLADKVGISVRTLQAFESGARPLEKAQVRTVIKLADALGCSVYDLVKCE